MEYILQVINLILLFVLIYYIAQNRNRLNTLKDDINTYIQKDMDNLKKVLEASLANDQILAKKTNFILNVLEEDQGVSYPSNKDVFDIENIDGKATLPATSSSWMDNLKSSTEFRKLLNVVE